MKCLREESIREFLDKEVSKRRLKSIECHLSVCVSCREKTAFMEKQIDDLRTTLDQLNPVTIPKVIMPQIVDSAGSNPGFIRRFFHSRVSLPIPGLVAAGALILILIVMFARQQRQVNAVSSKAVEAKGVSAYLVIARNDHLHEMPIDIDLTGYTLIESPNVFIVREGKDER